MQVGLGHLGMGCLGTALACASQMFGAARRATGAPGRPPKPTPLPMPAAESPQQPRGIAWAIRVGAVAAALAGAVTALGPSTAQAQYKNTSFSMDTGYWMISKPALLTADGSALKPAGSRPLRLRHGLRLGLDSSIKMDTDRWWFTGRVNVGFLRYGADANESNPLVKQYDELADASLGTILGFQAGASVRYYFMTDRVRPYLQTGLSYLRLFSFSNQEDVATSCTVGGGGAITSATLCGSGVSNYNNFLPHPNVGTVHLQPGIEIIVARDVALHFAADFQRWLVFNAEDNLAVTFILGLTLYS